MLVTAPKMFSSAVPADSKSSGAFVGRVRGARGSDCLTYSDGLNVLAMAVGHA